jgi:hypothetical protein
MLCKTVISSGRTARYTRPTAFIPEPWASSVTGMGLHFLRDLQLSLQL